MEAGAPHVAVIQVRDDGLDHLLAMEVVRQGQTQSIFLEAVVIAPTDTACERSHG